MPGVRALADAIVVLWGWRRFAVATAAGAVSAFAFAPFNAFPLLFLTVPVFVLLIDGAEPDEQAPWFARLLPAASVGFAFGFGFFVAGLWWIGAAFLVDAGAFAWALPIAVVVLPAILALFWAFGAALARLFWREDWTRLAVFAAALSLAEWLRGHLFTGFPWNAFGYALTPTPVMMQSASLVGIWGLTLVAFFAFAAPVVLLDRDIAPRTRLRVLAAAAALLVLHVGYGALRLLGGPDATVPGVHLRIVQPAIPQDEHWQVTRAGEMIKRYLDLSRDGAPEMTGATHVFWPESAFPFVLTDRPDVLAAIAALLPEGTVLVTGAARAERDTGGPPLVYNSLYAIDDRGEIRAAYDKEHLVPFGEYLPFGGLLRAVGVRQLAGLADGFTPGPRRRTIDIPGAPPAAPLICYEVIFPGAVVDEDQRPQWIVNLTNDAWYGATPGPYQHLHQARVRAVEEGLPLIRAANDGISAIIDGHGRLVASLGLGKTGIVSGELPVALNKTMYARFGDILWFLMLVVAAGCAGRKYLPKDLTDN